MKVFCGLSFHASANACSSLIVVESGIDCCVTSFLVVFSLVAKNIKWLEIVAH